MSTTITTIETAGLRFLTESGGELDYSSGRDLTMANTLGPEPAVRIASSLGVDVDDLFCAAKGK